MRKLIALMATIVATLTMTLIASPANAVTDNGSCTYDNSGVNPVSTSLTVVVGDGGRFYVTGELWNDGENRTWDWQMFHNGSLSFDGTKTGGGWAVERTMVNFNGPDTIEFRVRNAARTVDCWARVIY